MLSINPEFKKLIPPLTADEFQQLEANCLAEGIRDAIVVWNGYILDGHNRYEIATKHGLEYRTEEKSFESEDDAMLWMLYNQLGRRNLTDYVKGELYTAIEDLLKQKNINSKAEKVSHFRKTGEVLSTVDNTSSNTREEISAQLGWSTGKKAMFDVVKKKAPEEVKEKLRAGDMSINQAYKEIKQDEKIKERVELIEKQKKEIAEENLPALVGKYTVISVDPPWPYGREYNPETSRVANPYPEMSIDEIKAIDLPFKEDAILFLWTTHMFLPYAFEIVKHWGFDYKATLVWDKQKIGMGAWFRMQCEFCIFAIKGKPNYYNTTERDLISEARREHSRKPDAFFEMVDKICIGRKLEYFSREQRNGWDVFGNDTQKF